MSIKTMIDNIRAKKQMENPVIKKGPLVYTFYSEKYYKYGGIPNDFLSPKEREEIATHYGWKVTCVDKTTPIVGLVMEDSINGFPVDDVCECFKGCRNIVSISHFPKKAINTRHSKGIHSAFEDCSIEQIPQGLEDRPEIFETAYNIKNNKENIQPDKEEDIKEI
jgi:hypothetical protein